jgi:hypothetical protein
MEAAGCALAVVVADRDGPHGRLLLHAKHRLDVELAHDVHVGARVVAPGGRKGVAEPVPGGLLPFPVREKAVVDHRSRYVGTWGRLL